MRRGLSRRTLFFLSLVVISALIYYPTPSEFRWVCVFTVLSLDAQVERLARSDPRVGPGGQVIGDARALPFGGGSVDCVMTISAMHLVGDAAGALAEARRVIGGGPYVLQAFTRESLA